MLSDEQMSNGYPFSLLNDEQMSNKVRVEHQPAIYIYISSSGLAWMFFGPKTPTQPVVKGTQLGKLGISAIFVAEELPELLLIQGIVGCTPIPTYPYGKSLYKPYILGIYGL